MKELWKHQEAARVKAKELKYFGFFFEVGAGKTGSCIGALRDKYNDAGEILRTLIIGPPIVVQNWKREFDMFSKIPQHEICTLQGTNKKRLKIFNKTKAHIIITNFEVLSIAAMKELYEAIIEWKPTVLVIDESHRIKDYRAKRTKSAIELADRATFKYILTGTPILNSLLDIFTQYRVLDGGETFGKNYIGFRQRFFYDKNKGMPRDKYFPDWTVRQEAAGVIKDLLARSSMHVTKDECLDLPPFIKTVVPVELDVRQNKVYNEMKANFIAFMDGRACTADLALTKALRLQQIVSGHLPVEDLDGNKEILIFQNNPRMKALKEILSDIAPAHKVIVWAVFKENYKDIEDICEKLKLKYVEIHGGITAKNKDLAVDSFNNDPSIRVLIGHPGSGGIGINLIAASYSIFYSRSFSLEFDIQAEARNYRGGSERHAKVTRIDIVTLGTIDELVLKSLASKQQIGYQVLRDNMGEL